MCCWTGVARNQLVILVWQEIDNQGGKYVACCSFLICYLGISAGNHLPNGQAPVSLVYSIMFFWICVLDEERYPLIYTGVVLPIIHILEKFTKNNKLNTMREEPIPCRTTVLYTR